MVIVIFLYFTVLFAFYACKKDIQLTCQIGIKLKQISLSTNHLVKVQINIYIHKHYADVQDCTF